MEIKRLIWWIFGALVSLLSLITLLTKFDAGAVADHLLHAWKMPLFIALVYSLVANLVFSAWQWRVVYSEMGNNLPLLEHLFVKSAIYPLRAVVPFRAGDLGRPIYMARSHSIPIAKSLAANALILAVNTCLLLFFSVIGFLAAGMRIRALATFVALAVILAVAWVIRGFLLDRGRRDALGWLDEKIQEIHWVAKIPTMSFVPIILLGLVSIFGQVMEFSLIASAMNVQLSLQTVLSFVPIIILFGSIPVSLMGLGVREAAAVFLLTSYASSERILSVGLMFTMTDQLLLAFIGIAALIPFVYACRVRDWPTLKDK